MTNQQITQLEAYYEKQYGKPHDDNEAIVLLQNTYSNLVRFSTLTEDVKQGIAEYYRIVAAKGLPAYLWLMEAIHSLAKKNANKQSFPYMVGIIRQWLIHGFGHMPSREEDDVTCYFLETTCLPGASIEAKKIIKNLMGTYGVVKLTRTIGELNANANLDLSKIFAEHLKEILDKKYIDTSADSKEYDAPVSTIAEVVHFKPKTKTTVSLHERGSQMYRAKMIKEATILEQTIQKMGDVKFSQLQKATNNHIDWTSNPHAKLATLLKYTDNVTKKNYGVYGIK